MKKTVCFLVALLLLCSLSGCFSEDYQVLVIGGYTGEAGELSQQATALKSGVQLTVEYDYWEEKIEPPQDLERERVFQLAGQEVRGVYVETLREALSNYIVHRYRCGDDDWISVDDRGMIVSFTGTADYNQTERYSQDECVEIAKEFLSQYVDPEDYQMTVQNLHGDYIVTFVRCNGEYATRDRATITVTSSGQIELFSSYMLGRMAEYVDVTIDMQDLEEAAVEKLETLYAGVKERYSKIEYTLDEMSYQLAFGKDNEPLMFLSAGVTCNPKDSDGAVIVDGVHFVVPLS